MTLRRGAVTVAALGVFALTGCGGAGPSEDTAAGSPGRNRFLSFGTAPPGGAFFVVGGALAEALNERSVEELWEVTSEATSGSQENIRRLATGELDLALSNAAITYFAVRGSEGWDRAYAVRSIMTLAPNVALFVTPAASGIRQLTDLAGQRVTVGPAGAGFDYFVKPLLAEHGVSYESFTPLNATQAAAVDMLADGAVAAAFLGGAVPTASITQASASQDVYFIPFSEDGRRTAIDRYPFFRPATIPAGTYRGQDDDFEGLDVGSMHLITSASQDEDLVYRFTKTIYENRESVTAKHPAGRAINPQNAIRDTGTEFHPGAIRYYQEIGIWPDPSGTAAPSAGDAASSPASDDR